MARRTIGEDLRPVGTRLVVAVPAPIVIDTSVPAEKLPTFHSWIGKGLDGVKTGERFRDLDDRVVTFMAGTPRGADEGKWFLKMTKGLAEDRARLLGLEGAGVFGYEPLGIWFAVTILTPSMAKKLIAPELNFNNRKFRKMHAATIRAGIAFGQWWFTHQGGAFGWDYEKDSLRLLDMQQRCFAIAESNFAVPILICLNLSTEAARAIDMGAVRSSTDQMQFYTSVRPNSFHAKVASFLIRGSARRLMIDEESRLVQSWTDKPRGSGVEFVNHRRMLPVIAHILRTHEEEIQWVFNEFPDTVRDLGMDRKPKKHGIKTMPVISALVAFYISYKRDKIEQKFKSPMTKLVLNPTEVEGRFKYFIKILTYGDDPDSEQFKEFQKVYGVCEIARMLRERLTTLKSRRGQDEKTFAIVQDALKKWMSFSPKTTLSDQAWKEGPDLYRGVDLDWCTKLLKEAMPPEMAAIDDDEEESEEEGDGV